MGTVQKTTPADLLLRFHDRLVKRLVTDLALIPDASAVGITAQEPPQVVHTAARQEVLVRPADESARDEFASGASS